MYKAVIIDDESDAIQLIQTYLEIYFPSIDVVGVAQELSDAVNLLVRPQIDFIFLDIEMHGITSFDLLDKIKVDENAKIIFTTGHKDYAYRAFNVRASAYLLKPISPKVFVSSMQDVLAEVDNARTINTMQKEVELMYAIPLSKSFRLSSLKQVLYCESDSRYTHFYLTNQKKYTIAKSLKKVEEELSSNEFLRIHQSFLVNKTHIDEYNYVESIVVLTSGKKLPVSRNKKNELKQLFKKGVIQ